ncbi:MAG: sigma-54-dependent Fis family transcriptional regulator [Deltaproteobacteria bacterium]|uniref:Sigma-54-dependent Fis family transcriptional regulator n=1 Tax=Candidatus Zymogenus saltonus TaxID=2844893 RepID=A0A9D8PKC5_9DELT|nr:sigma-54-dependent Fis family transcriptional regulator [Candidatus Zymogenus saltonus]
MEEERAVKVSRILVVDDEPSMRNFLDIMLKKEGYEVDLAVDGKQALSLVESKIYDLVITDIMMPGIGGTEVLKGVKEVHPETMVIMITAYASTESAVEAMKEGAYDYILKPFNVDEIKVIIGNALDKGRLERENILLRRELGKEYSFENIIGISSEMLKVFSLINRVADTKTNILITGESGTGKELVARAIHNKSGRKNKPFVVINCGGIPENLLESDLFGHVKGAFTGAVTHKEGLFEVADTGTIFLDEVGELTPSIQVKLLRAIQERTFKRVGGTEDISVDVRIIAATNKELEKEIMAGRFREDLYYRLNVIEIKLPLLKDRKEDIPILAHHFMEKFSLEQRKKIMKISSYAMDVLKEYSFPGNVRELENIIERSVALESSNIVLPESLSLSMKKVFDGSELEKGRDLFTNGFSMENYIEDIEKKLIVQALNRAGGKKKEAARILGTSYWVLLRKIEKYDIK